MPEAPEVLEETVTVEEDPGTPTSHVSIVTSEDGTTRRTETKVWLDPGKKRVAWASIASVEQVCELAPKNHLFGWGIEATLALPWALEPPNPFATFLSIRSRRQSRL